MTTQHFDPPLWLRNPHVQNIVSSTALRRMILKRRHRQLLAQAQVYELKLDHGVRLQGRYTAQAEAASAPMMILFHGWEGSSESGYLLSMAGEAFRRGCSVFRLNFRDHGDTHHLNRGIFNSSMIDEVVAAVAKIQADFAKREVYLVGYSLGGNFALRVATRAHELHTPLAKVAAVCPVIIPENSYVALENSLGIYSRYFTRKWKRSLQKKLQHFPEYNYGATLKRLHQLQQLNEHFIPRYTSYSSVSQYFRSYAVGEDSLEKVRTNTLIIASADDPIIPIEDVLALEQRLSTKVPTLHFEIQRRGAHCAYLTGVGHESWADRRILDFFQLCR